MTRLTIHANDQCPCLDCVLDRGSRPAMLLCAGSQVVLAYDYSQRLGQLAIAVREWRDARCMKRDGSHSSCDGDNHLEDCAVEIARQEMLDAHNRVPT